MTGALDWTSAYTYNGLGQVTKIVQEGGTTIASQWRTRTSSYDSLGQMYARSSPEAGSDTFTFDNNGNILTVTNANNATTTYTYDALNRPKTKVLSTGAGYTYTYDANDESADPNGKGRLTSASNGSNAGFYMTHDTMGRLASEKYCLPSNCSYTQAVQATYDYHGNVMSLTYPDGRIIDNAYNLLDRLTGSAENFFLYASSRAAIPFSALPLPYFISAVYYPAGELNTAVYGLSVQVTTAFNKRHNLTSLTYSHSTQTLWSKSYSWDRNAENLLSATDRISGNVRSFTYDNVNRLISTTDSSGGISDTYTMDAWGNRQESGTFNFIQPFSSANRISATGYVYDLSGNLTADGLGNTYTYDADGKMSASNGATYTRDPFGQRIRKDVGGAATEYFYFGGALLATRDPSNGHGTDYVYAGGRLIAEIPVASGSPDFPDYRLGDHLDSLVQKTDAAGNLLGTNDVSPYGELFSSSASDPLLFTQHERDAENGNDSTLYRQYASDQGRWLSPDPSNGSYNLYDPQSFNR